MFTHRHGTHYGQNILTKEWNNAVKKAGFAPTKLYDATRHSFASQLRKAGANLSDIQEFLGHTEIKMTGRYAHAEQGRLTRVIELKR